MNLSWHNTAQHRVLSHFTYFYRSYCPWLKFSFQDFSLRSFEILTWNLMYEFVMTWNKSSLSFVMLDLLLQELLPFAQMLFSRLFSAVFWDIQLKFCIWIAFVSIQIKFEFRHAWPSFTGVNAVCKNLFFPKFSLSYFDSLIWNYFWALLICCYRSYASWKFVGAGGAILSDCLLFLSCLSACLLNV